MTDAQTVARKTPLLTTPTGIRFSAGFPFRWPESDNDAVPPSAH